MVVLFGRVRLNRKILLASGIIFLLVVGRIIRAQYLNVQERRQARLAMMYTVEPGNLSVDVKVTATVNLMNEQNLSFGQEGKITNVYVQVGDEVEAGDVLAELDMDDYYTAVEAAQLELSHAKLALEKLLNNDTSVRQVQLQSQIQETQDSRDIEQQQLTILQQQLDTALQQKQDQLAQLQSDLSLAQKGLQIAESGLEVDIATQTETTTDQLTSRQQTVNAIISDLRSSLGEAEYVVSTIDKIFGVSRAFKDGAEIYQSKLSAKNTSYKRDTQSLISRAYGIINEYKQSVSGISSESDDTTIYQLTNDLYSELEILIQLADSALEALDNSTIGESLSQTTLDGFVSTVSTMRATASTLRAELLTLASSLNSLLASNTQQGQLQVALDETKLNYEKEQLSVTKLQDQIDLLQQEISTLQADHLNQVQRKQAQITTLSQNIYVLQQELNDLLDGADIYDIQQAENIIQQATVQLDKTEDQQDNYQIIADFDGRVRTVDIVEGEQYELDNRKFIVVENPNLIELELQVSQIDIVKIHEGDPVIITFDAYPNRPIEAAISSRNVNPTPNGRGGVFYEATILLEKQDLEILAGMSAIVDIVTASKEAVLLIPTLAVVNQQSKQYVYLYQDGEYRLHQVELGLANNFQVEVISGLSDGDIIKKSVLDEELLSEMGIDDQSNTFF